MNGIVHTEDLCRIRPLKIPRWIALPKRFVKRLPFCQSLGDLVPYSTDVVRGGCQLER
jgi:hypothetical protein